MTSRASRFEIKFTRDAFDDVHRLDGSVKQKLHKAIQKKLSVDPEGYGTPLRAELAGYHKHQFASHRIIYRLYPEKNLVVICAVGPRKSGDVQDVYNQLGRLVQSGKLAKQIQDVLTNMLKK